MAILTLFCWWIEISPVGPFKHKGAYQLYRYHLTQKSLSQEHLYDQQVLSEDPMWYLLPMLHITYTVAELTDMGRI